MLDSLSMLIIEADLLRKINFLDIIKDFAIHTSREKNLKMQVHVLSYPS